MGISWWDLWVYFSNKNGVGDDDMRISNRILIGFDFVYPLVMTNSLPWKDPPFLIGKPSINGPFSVAMLNNQKRVIFLHGF